MDGYHIFCFFVTIWLGIIITGRTGRIQKEIERQGFETRNLIIACHDLGLSGEGNVKRILIDRQTACITNVVYKEGMEQK